MSELNSRLNHSIANPPQSQEEIAARLASKSAMSPSNPEATESLEATKRPPNLGFVYVPLTAQAPSAVPGEGPQEVQFELRILRDGSAGLPVFLDEESLISQLGPQQPKAAVHILDLLAQVAKVPVVINPIAESGLKPHGPEDLPSKSKESAE